LQAHDDAFIKPKTENTGDTVLLPKMISESPLLGLLRVRAAPIGAPSCLLRQPGVPA
jgi:hypothetical protein